MSNIGEQLQNRVRVSEKVVASARTHCGKIAVILADQAIEAEGPATPATVNAFRGVIFALANGLEYCMNAMRKAEQAVTTEKADDVEKRAKRDAKTAEVGGMVTRLRSTIDDHLGSDGTKRYGLTGETSRVPRKLVEQTQNVVHLLEQAPIQLTSSFGTSFDSAMAASTLKVHAAELDALVADDDKEVRELEDAFAVRDRAVEAWSDAYQGTATALEGLYRRAGFKDLAEKVRPTVRKMRGEDTDDNATDEPKPENG